MTILRWLYYDDYTKDDYTKDDYTMMTILWWLYYDDYTMMNILKMTSDTKEEKKNEQTYSD